MTDDLKTTFKVCFGCKRTTRHVQLQERATLSRYLYCGTIRDENSAGSRLPAYEKRGIGILCDDGTREMFFPLLTESDL